MRSTEIVNARLVSVTGRVGDDDWDQAALAGDAKWGQPNVGAFYEEGRQRVLSASGPRTHVWRGLSVREELGIDWQVGDVVTFRPDDLDADLVGVVSSVEDPHTPRGQGGEIRLLLDLVAA